MNGTGKDIRILVVDDSPTVRQFLEEALSSYPGLRVVGAAPDGNRAIEMARREKPDVITMDVHLPGMDGFEAARRIMETQPTPIVMVSGSVDVREVQLGFRAMEAGALAIVPRPRGFADPRHAEEMGELVRTLRMMSEIRVVRRWPQTRAKGPDFRPGVRAGEAASEGPMDPVGLVAVGASTGGPIALKTLLSGLPKTFPAPLAIVQHMSAGFTDGFVEWLAKSSQFPVIIPEHGRTMEAGRAYIAPQGVHMAVDGRGRILLDAAPPENGMRPSVSRLFGSAAEAYGPRAVGVLLTGMGRDGALELKAMKEKGAVTIAQDRQTSVVHGMPGEAIRLDAASHVLPLDAIAPMLERLVTER